MKTFTLTMYTLAAVLLAIMVLGCRSVQYSHPDGHKVSIVNLGFDTKLQSFSIEKTTEGGKLTLEGYDSSGAASVDLMKQMLDKLPN